MESPCWSSLPDEAILNILARLPLLDFLRHRSVCKSWNQLAFEREFLRLRSILSDSRPTFALLQSGDDGSELVYLDMSTPQTWRKICFDFFPCGSRSVEFLAVSGSLLLLQITSRNDGSPRQGSDLVVCNPIARSCQKLPLPAVVHDPFYAAMAADPSTGDFVVVIADSEMKDPANTEIFHSKRSIWQKAPSTSRAGRWKTVAGRVSTPWQLYGPVPVYCKPVFCKGSFYHVTWDLEDTVSEDMVSAFSVEEGVWRCVRGKGTLPGGEPWGVMEVGGRVLLVEMSHPEGGAVESRMETDASLTVWELETGRLEWVMKERIPSPPRDELLIEKWRRFAVGDGLICTTFLISGAMIRLFDRSEAQPGMIYDLSLGSWTCMPDLPGTPRGKISSLFSFQPSLISFPSSPGSSSSS